MLRKVLLLAFLCASLLAPISGILAQAQPATQAVKDSKSAAVYTTKTGKKYHRAGCQYLSKSQIKTTIKEAQANGYTACCGFRAKAKRIPG